ncbi:MAG: HPr(Ser) kinase/phosphatase [Elusimicrobiota bacterium]|jgi:HPr kinase/phosphorylase|nr:HPr(Ser) kinase/phosphatase [Elusimicrobiota bacterium]
MQEFLRVRDFFSSKEKDLKLELIAGKGGLDRKITVSDISRPGLAFTGYFMHFPYERTQVIGKSEFAYLESLPPQKQAELLNKIFSHENAVCCILTSGLGPTPTLIETFDKLNVPLFMTSSASSALIAELIYYLDAKLAPNIKLHGVLVSVYGLGVFIIGKSGIGKSECALELVKRGHMLIADDIVHITKHSGHSLFGQGLSVAKHLIEVRGVGIIDIRSVFGIGNTLDEIKLGLVLELKEWDEVKKPERVGIEEQFREILDVNIPSVVLPVGPGRNLAVLVETACLNQRLKNKGFFVAREFGKRISQAIEDKKNAH